MKRLLGLGLFVLPGFLGVLTGCGGGSGAGEGQGGTELGPEDIGRVELLLATVPTGVTCVRATITESNAAGGGPILATYSAAPASGLWSATIGLGAFSAGSIQITASAYAATCANLDVAPVPNPTWIATPVTTQVILGAKPVVKLDFKQVIPVAAAANFAPSVASIALGLTSTGFILADGTVRMVGSIGSPAASFNTVVELSVGGDHACARKADGTAWCWGADGDGKLGNGPATAPNNTTPVQVTGLTGVTTIAAGDFTSCASTKTNTYCWGSGASGALGNGGTASADAPVAVSGIFGSAKIVTSSDHTCALSVDGFVRCWGSNNIGQLGNGGTGTALTPTLTLSSATAPASPLKGIVSLAMGSVHGCAVDVTGKASCWGYNIAGQLGTGNTTNTTVATAVTGIGTPANPVVEVTAGDWHSCARTASNAVYCWGSGAQVGDGTATSRPAPTLLPSLSGARTLRAGGATGRHTCALMPDVSVWCWGDNDQGQLSDGTYISRFSPQPMQL